MTTTWVVALVLVGAWGRASARPAAARRATVATVRRTTTITARPRPTTRPTSTTATSAAPVVSDLVPGVGAGTPPRDAQGGGPWSTRVRLARSPDGLTFTADAAPLVDQAGVPNLMSDAVGRARLYYVDWANGNIIAAAVETAPGRWAHRRVTIVGRPPGASAVDPTVLLVGTTYRLWFSQGGVGTPMAVHTASSTDGFTFRYDGVAFQAAGPVPDPTVVRLGNRWLLWAGPDGANAATSIDGVHFTPAAPVVVDGSTLMVWSAAVLPDGRVRVFGNAVGPGRPGLLSATSADGATWVLDRGSRIGASDHGVLRRPDGSWLLALVERI